MMDRKEVEALRALLAKATPGPWSIEPTWAERCGGSVAIANRDHMGEDWDVCSVHSTEANAALIAAAVNALPELLRVYGEWLDAPEAAVIEVTTTHTDYTVLDGLDWPTEEKLIGQRVRLLPAGDASAGGESE